MNQNKTFLQSIAQEYIRSKRFNYNESKINFLIDDPRYLIEDLGPIINIHGQRIKCTLIKHRISYKDRLQQSSANSVCLIYLHGLRSNRIESLQLLQYLPKQICLCAFDFSGSGVSEGPYVTYGLKQQEDIEVLIQFLFNKKYIREFAIWGRSMGAVAALLYVNNYRKRSKKKMLSFTLTQQKWDHITANRANQVIKFQEGPIIKSVILDSPFQNFRDLARLIGLKTLKMPEFMLNIGLDYVEETIGRILNQHYKQNYNPFLINFDSKIRVDIPIIMIYSRSDQLIPFSHFEKIVSNIESKCQVFELRQCKHNEQRPQHTIKQIVNRISREGTYFQQQSNRIEKCSLVNKCEKKKGIMVVCSSRQKNHIKSKRSLINQKLQDNFIIKISQIHTQQDRNFLQRRSEIQPRRGLQSLNSVEKNVKCKQQQLQYGSKGLYDNKLIGSKKTLKKENQMNLSSKRTKFSFKNDIPRNKTDIQHQFFLKKT